MIFDSGVMPDISIYSIHTFWINASTNPTGVCSWGMEGNRARLARADVFKAGLPCQLALRAERQISLLSPKWGRRIKSQKVCTNASSTTCWVLYNKPGLISLKNYAQEDDLFSSGALSIKVDDKCFCWFSLWSVIEHAVESFGHKQLITTSV